MGHSTNCARPETMLRASDIIGRAIERFEAMRPASDAFQQWQNVQQAQWYALMQGGGRHLLDVEAQAHHAAEVRRAEVRLTEVLRAYFASGGPGAGREE